MEYKRLKKITSHVGFGRFLAESMPVGYIARVASIASAYAYSPTDRVRSWNGKNVIARETSHKFYEVFEVPAEVKIYQIEEELEAILFAK